jgi:hypothetical protein
MTKQHKTNLNRTMSAAGLALAMALGAGFSPAALAQAVLSNFTYVGSGCPAGSAKAAVINNGRTLHVDFSAFKVAMNGTKGTPSTECAISAWLTAPSGSKIEIHPADYAGNYSDRAKIRVDAGHTWANVSAGPWSATAGNGGKASTYRLTNPKPTQFGICGGKNELKDDGTKGIKLTINAADMVSADIKTADYTLNYLPCKNTNGGEGDGGEGKGGKGPGG